MGLVRTLAAFEALKDDWDALSARHQSPLLDHDWLACCAQAFHADGDLRVVTLVRGDRLMAAAPLAVDRSRGRRLAMLGASTLHEPGGWLHESADAHAALRAAVTRLGERVVMQRVPRSDAVHGVRFDRAARAMVVTRAAASSNGVEIGESWPSYERRLSARTRRNLAQARLKAEATTGPVRFTTQLADPGDVEGHLETLIGLEGAGWKGRHGSALAARQDLAQFFSAYGIRAAARRRLRISQLRFGEALVAMELAVEAYDRHWGLKVAYDERWATSAPALQLVHACIETAFDRGLRSYEFLGSAEGWQDRWQPTRRAHDLVALYPLGVRGAAGAIADLYAAVGQRLRSRPEPSQFGR